MIICHSQRFVIGTPPKTYSTSLHQYAQDAGWQTTGDQHAFGLEGLEDYRRFAVVRHPVDRAMSLYWHLLHEMRRHVAARVCVVPQRLLLPQHEDGHDAGAEAYCEALRSGRAEAVDGFYWRTCVDWVPWLGVTWLRSEFLLQDMAKHGIQLPRQVLPWLNDVGRQCQPTDRARAAAMEWGAADLDAWTRAD